MRSGQPDQIQAVVDELSERQRQYGLSQGEHRMLKRAIEMLGEANEREP
jgi:RNA polymerase-interacting CarD/CdnL/TRCF family regulator